MTFRHVERGGTYSRVADPDWPNPLDGSHAAAGGARWNPPGSFPVVYLNRDVETARANVRGKFEGQPFQAEDLRPDRRPNLVHTDVPTDRYVDVVTDAGCKTAGLPATYPLDAHGKEIPHETCQPIGLEAWEHGEPGIACRSAAPAAPPAGEELAWFERDTPLEPLQAQVFERWYWAQAPL